MIEFLLSHPLTRGQIAVSKVLAYTVSVLFLMLVLASIAADLASLGWNPLATVVDALLSPYSPLAIFRARWMLIDV